MISTEQRCPSAACPGTMRWLRTVIAISDNDVSHSTALSALAIVRPETVIRWHRLLSESRYRDAKKAQDTREPIWRPPADTTNACPA